MNRKAQGGAPAGTPKRGAKGKANVSEVVAVVSELTICVKELSKSTSRTNKEISKLKTHVQFDSSEEAPFASENDASDDSAPSNNMSDNRVKLMAVRNKIKATSQCISNGSKLKRKGAPR